MSGRKIVMKFTFFTDTHLTGQNPEERSDDFAEAILSKIDQVYNRSQEYGSDFVLFGGDLFNTHKIYSYKIMEKLISIIKKYKLQTYFIVGQHDLYGYEQSSYVDSALCFIEKMSDGLLVKVDTIIPISKDIECNLHACHVYNNPTEHFESIVDDGKFNISMVHALLYDKKKMFETLSIFDIKTKANLVLAGDLHDGFPYRKLGNTSFYNSGAIARTKCNDIDRDIKMGLFEVVKKGEYEITFSEHFLTYAPANEVFHEPSKEYKSDFVGFVEEIDDIEKSAVDIIDLIKMWAETNKELVRPGLINYILKFRKNA